MKKKDLIKLALIGLTSTVCLAAKDSDELNQTLAMYRRNCKGYRCRGNKDCGGRRRHRRGCNGHYGAKTKEYNNSQRSSCRGKNSCESNVNGDKNSCKGSDSGKDQNSCSGSNGCSGNTKDRDSCRGGSKCRSGNTNGKDSNSCAGKGGCSGNSSKNHGKDLKKADKNAKKRYESSF